MILTKLRVVRRSKLGFMLYKITVVHVEHFASQGALIPNWLGENKSERSKLGGLAIESVKYALAK